MTEAARPSRQAEWQRARLREGLCSNCGREPLAYGRSDRYGEVCLEKMRKRAQVRAKKKHGGRGKPSQPRR